MKRMLALACMAALVIVGTPAAADPPEASGAVVRSLDDTGGFGILLDTTNEYWVFSNITRDAFCAWFNDPEAPFPGNEDPDDLMFVMSADAEHLLVHGGGPTALHAWAGDGPGGDPCTGSLAEHSLAGDVRVRVVDNDLANEGKRANSFGNHGNGRVFDAAGNAYHYSWRFHGLWNPDGTEFRVLSDRFTLTPTG